jgi:hypothetical protein
MRKQFHFRPSKNGYFAWNVERLVKLCKELPIQQVDLSNIREVVEPYWYGDPSNKPTVESIIEHARLIEEADLKFPIILSSDGRVMDGMHRVAKAILKGHKSIFAFQFTIDPKPDYEDVKPTDFDSLV